MSKIFLSGNEINVLSILLAKKVFEEEKFIPDIIIGLWRGGTPIAINVQEYFRHNFGEVIHFPIKTESYIGVGSGNQQKVKISGLDEYVGLFKKGTKVLLVDDIWDTGRTMNELIRYIKSESEDVTVKVATLYFKSKKNIVNNFPDFFLFDSDAWIVFPHEIEGCVDVELKRRTFESNIDISYQELYSLGFNDLKKKLFRFRSYESFIE